MRRDNTTDGVSRRKVLKGVGAAVATSVAGCSGSSGSGDAGSDKPTDPTEEIDVELHPQPDGDISPRFYDTGGGYDFDRVFATADSEVDSVTEEDYADGVSQTVYPGTGDEIEPGEAVLAVADLEEDPGAVAYLLTAPGEERESDPLDSTYLERDQFGGGDNFANQQTVMTALQEMGYDTDVLNEEF